MIFLKKNWEEAEQWQRDSAIKGVEFRLENPDAGTDGQHNAWMAEKIADGWVYGEEKNANAKTHPCIIEYSKLPDFQKKKDSLFVAIVDSLKDQQFTNGMKAVGYNFNPSNMPEVDKAKRLNAELIDLLDRMHLKATDNGNAMSSWFRNVFRTAAFNAIIAAQMAIVKYLTWKD